MINAKDQVRALLKSIRQDAQRYDELNQLLSQQREAMLTCNTKKLADINELLMAHYQQLQEASSRRRATLKQLNLPTDSRGMTALLKKLPPLLSTQAQHWWQYLEQRARHCQKVNEQNGTLLATQREVMQSVSAQSDAGSFLYKA